MSRLRENNLNGCHIFKDFYHNIISIIISDWNDVNGVIHTLKIPMGVYELYEEDLLIVVDVPLLEQKQKEESRQVKYNYARV